LPPAARRRRRGGAALDHHRAAAGALRRDRRGQSQPGGFRIWLGAARRADGPGDAGMTRRAARTCAVEDCSAAASARRPFCTEHWKKLPGRTRSTLSLSASFGETARRRDAIAAAAALLSEARDEAA